METPRVSTQTWSVRIQESDMEMEILRVLTVVRVLIKSLPGRASVKISKKKSAETVSVLNAIRDAHFDPKIWCGLWVLLQVTEPRETSDVHSLSIICASTRHQVPHQFSYRSPRQPLKCPFGVFRQYFAILGTADFTQ